MADFKRAKIFRNGASQAVRLPAEFRFESSEVFVSRDEETGDVRLSTRPGAGAWDEFFRMYPAGQADADFMTDRPMNRPPVDKDIFSDELTAEGPGFDAKQEPAKTRRR